MLFNRLTHLEFWNLCKDVILDQPLCNRPYDENNLQKTLHWTVLFVSCQAIRMIMIICKEIADSWYSIFWVASIGCAELKDRFFRFRTLYWGAPKFFRWFCIEVRQPGSLAPHVLSRWKVLAGKCSAFLFNRSPSIDRDVCWGDGLAINIFLKQRHLQALWWWKILVSNFVFKQLVITVKYSDFNKSSIQKPSDDPWCLG